MRAQQMLGVSVEEAAYQLGNGSRTLSQDTVPFTLWVAATYLNDYPSAIRACIHAGGDVDTTAAIAGGIVATYVTDSPSGIPSEWLQRREALPEHPIAPQQG
jgi:ADP-ribosylglycohydrolase